MRRRTCTTAVRWPGRYTAPISESSWRTSSSTPDYGAYVTSFLVPFCATACPICWRGSRRSASAATAGSARERVEQDDRADHHDRQGRQPGDDHDHHVSGV